MTQGPILLIELSGLEIGVLKSKIWPSIPCQVICVVWMVEILK